MEDGTHGCRLPFQDHTLGKLIKLQKLGLMQDLLTGKVAVTVDAPITEATA